MTESIFGNQGKKVVVNSDGELLVGNERISREETMKMIEDNFGKPRYLNFPGLFERVDLLLKKYSGETLLKKYEGEKLLKHYPTERSESSYARKESN